MKQFFLVLLIVVPELLAAQSETIIASDNFNRSDESPFAVGGNWQRTVAGPFDGSSDLTSGHVSGADSEGIYYWQGAGTFDNTRQFARATITQGSGEAGLVLLGGSDHAIMVSWGPPNSGGTVFIFWYNGPGETGGQLGTASSTVQSGDVIEAVLDEGTIYAKVNGSIVASVANTTTLTSGTPGFQTYLTGATLDNWEAGTPAPIYTISGTITEGGPGLAGVLVTASGGFTGSTTTDGTGAYTVAGVPSGATSIVLTPTLAGHVISPLTRTVNGPVTSNVSGEDFTSTANTYTLTVNATNGTVARDIDQPTYSHGTNVILTPTGVSGYHFVSWSGDAVGSDNPLTVTMDDNKTITANFAANQYTLTLTATNGTVAKNPDQALYDSSAVVQLTAAPNAGYHLTNWSGDVTGSANPVSVTMNADKNITANFAANLPVDVIASDDFNRADETPLVTGGDWQRILTDNGAGNGTVNLEGNRIVAAGGEALYHWQGSGTFNSASQYSRATVVQASGQVGLLLLGATGQAIVASWGGGTMFVYWYSGGLYQGSLTSTPSTLQAGDVIEEALDAGTVYIKVNGSIIKSVANTTTLTSGRPGFETFQTGAILDNWQAGTPPASYSISGTILENSNPLNGVTVTASSGGFNGSVITNASGVYTFIAIPESSVNIMLTPSLSGHTFSPATQTVSGPVIANVTGQDFTSTRNSDVVADDFNRTDETPFAITGNWRQISAGTPGSASLSSNQVVGNGGEALYRWNGTFNTSQFARATVTNAGGQVGLTLFGGTDQAIVVSWGGGTLFIYRYVGGAYQGNLGTVSSTLQNGDVIEAVLDAGTIRAKRNGVVLLSATNSTGISSGSPGFEIFGTGGTLDNFEAGGAIVYTITATAGANGTISPSGAVGVIQGANQTFTMTPATGHHVDSLLVDDVNVDSTTSYTFVNVTGNHTIRAVFRINQYTITASAGANGAISPSGTVSVNHGGSQAFTITPAIGYHVDSLLVDDVNVDSTTSYMFVNVTGNHTIRAVFRINQYTITASAGTNGAISPSGTVSVNHGGSQAFTITPAIGYHVDSLLVDDVNVDSTTSYMFVNVTGNHTIRAVFRINQYTITASAGTNGAISPSGAVSVNHGGSQSFTITPVTGYHVDTLLVDDVKVDSTTSYTFVNVTGGHSIRAIFRINQYTITASAGANGAISPSGAVNVNHGGSQSFTITPVTGYHVDTLLVDDVKVDSTTSYTFVNVTGGHSIRAIFRINQYTITASAGANGAISPSGAVNVNHGGSQAFTMTPATGYHVDSLLVDDVKVDSTTSYTFVNVTGNHTIRAVFRINQYTITASAGANGAISPSGVVNVNHGGNQSFTITPATGYHVDSLLVDDANVDSTTSYTFVNVTGNHTIRAVFRINQYTITASAGANGAISPSGVVNVNHGGNQSFTITPATGYHVDSLLVDDVKVDSITSYTFANVTTSHTIRAEFRIKQYSIAITAVNGTVTKDPDQALYDSNAVVQLTAIPNSGYHFVDWSGDVTALTNPVAGTISDKKKITSVPNTGHRLVNSSSLSESTNPLFVTMNADKNITATFSINQYSIAITAVNGSVTTNPDQAAYDSNSVVQLTAVPNSGYHFVNWSGDVTGSTNPVSVTMNANKSITANFAINQYSIAITAVDGSVTKNPDQAAYDSNSVVQLTAVPNNGYHFVNWSGDVTGSTNPVSVTVNSNKSITANFAINQYSIALTAVNGTVTKDPNQASYDSNSVVQLTAVPNSGYHFVDWSGDVTGSTNPVSVTMNANKSITANFAINQYSIAITAVNGTVTKDPDQALYDSNTVVQLTAIPNAGYHFVDWSGDVTGLARTPSIKRNTAKPTAGKNPVSRGDGVTESSNPLSVTMNADKNITADFAINQYSIAITAVNGSVTKNPDQASYDSNSVVQLIAVPNSGYHFVNWSGDVTGSTNPVSVTMNSNKSITANFSINQYSIAITASNGSVTKNPDQASYDSNSVVQLTAVPNSGYHFVDWSGDVTGSTNPVSVTMNANKSITANFTQTTYTLTYSAGSHGTISGITTQTVNSGSNGTAVTAVPDSGYHFVSWSDSVLTASRTDTNVTGNLTVTAGFAINPTITVTGLLATFTSLAGTPSPVQSYTVSGHNLTANIFVTAPADFELSLASSGPFSTSPVELTETGDTVGTTSIYVRMNRGTAGATSGNIIHTSTGATPQAVAVSGTVPVVANLKVFLEGPYNISTNLMATSIAPYLPFSQPYAAAPWSYSGTETVLNIPAGVVDWVLVELRSTETAVAATRAGFIRDDGAIVDLDGTSPLSFPSVAAGSYYVVIKHRNHLDVMSGATTALTGTSSLYDFSTGSSQFYGAANAAVELEAGVWGMIGGNADYTDQDCFSSDLAVIKTGILGSLSGYEYGDVDMDGDLFASDYALCKINVLASRSSQVPSVSMLHSKGPKLQKSVKAQKGNN